MWDSRNLGGFWVLAALAAFQWGCSGGASGARTANADEHATETSGSEGGTHAGSEGSGERATNLAEVRALVTELLTPQLCPKLIGSYIGLPGEGSATGPAAGTIASAGRWWIRTCEARVVGERLSLSIGGPGWTWVQREATGFRVRQYVLFEARAELGADVAVGYDAMRRIASVWMRPNAGVNAEIIPRGVVTAEPTGFFASLLSGVLTVTGSSASDRARAQAQELGSTQMRERLANGFTMTMNLTSGQTDFMVGALDRGEVPERPWPSDTSTPWQVNQRTVVWPGGVDVIGPLDTAHGPLGLDVELEEGERAQLQTICAEPMGHYFDARLQAPGAAPAAPRGDALTELTATGEARYVEIPAKPCPQLLLVSPSGPSALPVKLRLRVAAAGASSLAPRPPTAGASGTAGASIGPAPSGRWRIRLVSLSVSPSTARHVPWDVVGGEADPYVITVSVPHGRQVDRTETASDQNVVTLNRWLPGAFSPTTDLPLRFTIYDADTTTDELVGSCDLEAVRLSRGAADIDLAIRTSDAVPAQLGALRVHVEPVP